MGKLIDIEYGDILINHHLSEDNPEHTGVFVRERFSVITMTDTQGGFWTVTNDMGARLEVNGQLDFKAYLKDYNKKLKGVSNAAQEIK